MVRFYMLTWHMIFDEVVRMKEVVVIQNVVHPQSMAVRALFNHGPRRASGASDKVQFKPACSAAETSWNLKTFHLASVFIAD